MADEYNPFDAAPISVPDIQVKAERKPDPPAEPEPDQPSMVDSASQFETAPGPPQGAPQQYAPPPPPSPYAQPPQPNAPLGPSTYVRAPLAGQAPRMPGVPPPPPPSATSQPYYATPPPGPPAYGGAPAAPPQPAAYAAAPPADVQYDLAGNIIGGGAPSTPQYAPPPMQQSPYGAPPPPQGYSPAPAYGGAGAASFGEYGAPANSFRPPSWEQGNTSGTGMGDVPAEIDECRWNWGAFFHTFWWGLFHKAWDYAWPYFGFVLLYIFTFGFLKIFALVSFMGLAIRAGFNGNLVAWRNRSFPGGVQQFFAVQRIWMVSGFIWGSLLVTVIVGIIIFAATVISSILGHSSSSSSSSSSSDGYRAGYRLGSGGQDPPSDDTGTGTSSSGSSSSYSSSSPSYSTSNPSTSTDSGSGGAYDPGTPSASNDTSSSGSDSSDSSDSGAGFAVAPRHLRRAISGFHPPD